MAQVKFYKDGNLWIYADGLTEADKTAPAGNYRRIIKDTKVAIYGEYNVFSLFKDKFVEVTSIQKSSTPGDNYTDINDFIGATEDFFVSAAGGGGSYITDTVSTYANLPTPESSYYNQFWLVTNPSGGFLSWLGVYKYPKGVYAVNQDNDTWELVPVNVRVSEDSITLLNIQSWEQYYSAAEDIYVGDRVVYSDTMYENKTGTQTNTPPDVDTTNWRKLDYVFNQPNTVIIDPNGNGDFTSVDAALISITDASSTNRYTIEFVNGLHFISNPIQVPDYVGFKAQNPLGAILIADNPSDSMFIDAGYTSFIGLVLTGVTGVDEYCIEFTNPGASLVDDVIMSESTNGILVNNVNHESNVVTAGLENNSTPMNIGFHVTAGLLVTSFIRINEESTVDTFFEIDGSSAVCVISTALSKSPNLNTAFRFINGCEANIGNSFVRDCYDGVVVYGDNTQVTGLAGKIESVQNDAFRIDNIGTNIEVNILSAQLTRSGNLNINILNANARATGSGFGEVEKIFAVPNAQIYASIFDSSAQGEESLNTFGEFRVGTPLNPSESVFGEGDTYTRGMLVRFYDSITTNYTDITDDVSDPTTSTQLPSGSANSAIYFASAVFNGTDVLKHYGVKMIIDQAASIGTYVWEYWNGSTWESVHWMLRNANSPYESYAETLFQDAGSFQARLDPEIVNSSMSDWVKNDDPGVGTDLYWTRIRFFTGVTTAATVTQFKLHSNNIQLNEDGFVTKQGAARPLGTLGWSITDAIAWQSSPANQDLYSLDSADGTDYDLGVGLEENEFVSGVTDKISISKALPNDMDTSGPLIVEIYYVLNNAAAGDLYWKTSKGIKGVGEQEGYDTATAPTTIRDYEITNNILPIPVNSEYELRYMRFKIYVSQAIAQKIADGTSDIFTLAINRDGSDALDTYPGNAAIRELRVNYYKWSEGGHVE